MRKFDKNENPKTVRQDLKMQIGNWIWNASQFISDSNFSIVTTCQHLTTQYSAVVKIIDKELNPELAKNEIQVTNLIRDRHPNIVPIIEILEDSKRYYVIMERIFGGDLITFINNQKTPINDHHVFRIFSQILSGIQFLHENCIAHHDLKPENILISAEGHIYLIDFGFSCQLDPKNKFTDNRGGTLFYSPAEVLNGEFHDAYKVDIWSLGVILYIMATKKMPFSLSSREELELSIEEAKIKLCHRIKKAQFPIPKSMSPDLAELIQNMLHCEPHKRWDIPDIKKSKWYQAHCIQTRSFKRVNQQHRLNRVRGFASCMF